MHVRRTRWARASPSSLIERHLLYRGRYNCYPNTRYLMGSLCSINVSAQSLSDDGFLKFLKATLNGKTKLSNKLCFEITETSAISNMIKAKHFITCLKELGCKFALDDFGSGMSSFGYLKNLPVDYLKIDGSFVKDCAREPIDLAMVKSINEIGHIMKMQTIAECVEDSQTVQLLSHLNVDFVQGYAIEKPKPLS